MKFIVRLFLFLVVIGIALYFFKPELFQPKVYDVDTLDSKQYVNAPSPGKIFLYNLKLSSTNVYSYSSIWGSAKLYFDAVDIFQMNVLDLLENSNNKKLVLASYIKKLQDIQQKLDMAINSLEEIKSDEEVKYNMYQQAKEEWDTKFFEWFVQKDTDLVINGLNQALENGPTATKHRILKNASKVTLDKLKKIKYLVDAKLTLLQDNQTIIVDNFYVIKSDMLEKMRRLKYQLETNTYNTY